MALSEDDINVLKSKHGGELRAFRAGDERVYVKRPSRPDIKCFKQMVIDDKKRGYAADDLGYKCIVHPPRVELDILLERYPLVLERAANIALEMAGAEPDDEVEKL